MIYASGPSWKSGFSSGHSKMRSEQQGLSGRGGQSWGSWQGGVRHLEICKRRKPLSPDDWRKGERRGYGVRRRVVECSDAPSWASLMLGRNAQSPSYPTFGVPTGALQPDGLVCVGQPPGAEKNTEGSGSGEGGLSLGSCDEHKFTNRNQTRRSGREQSWVSGPVLRMGSWLWALQSVLVAPVPWGPSSLGSSVLSQGWGANLTPPTPRVLVTAGCLRCSLLPGLHLAHPSSLMLAEALSFTRSCCASHTVEERVSK